MAYAVELNLSTGSAARVVTLWKRFAEESISSVMLDVGAKPHISLASFEDLDPLALQDDLRHFAATTKPLLVALSSVGAFPTSEGVVFLAPVVTRELLDVHERFQGLLGSTGAGCLGYWWPGRWVPHCTVATEITPDKLGRAIELCLQSEVFGTVTLDEVSLIEFRPVHEIYAFPLRG